MNFLFATVEILSAPMLALGGLANALMKNRTARQVHRPPSRSSRAPSLLNTNHRNPNVNVSTKWMIIELIYLASCYVEHYIYIICLSSNTTHNTLHTHPHHTHTLSLSLQTSFYFNRITRFRLHIIEIERQFYVFAKNCEKLLCVRVHKGKSTLRERTASRRQFSCPSRLHVLDMIFSTTVNVHKIYILY